MIERNRTEKNTFESDPLSTAAGSMKPVFQKRFFKTATVKEERGKFTILLDGNQVKTPGKRLLSVEYDLVAKGLAKEWNGLGEYIDMTTMPLTRIVNSAVDGVADSKSSVSDAIASYIGSDLICYRADEPETLVARQVEQWDPILNWIRQRFDIELKCTTGIVHLEQPQASIQRVREFIDSFDCLKVAALYTVATICGSASLAIGLAEGKFSDVQIWNAANVDEDWNIEKWGEDEESLRIREFRRSEFDAANVILTAAKQ